ncbi:MAG: response regulator transcription factor [Acidobacteria bacterium]|nr:response regulator transcription factor [Acidobacteriota bacterium]MBI3473190.1 response regulator transcription factor [Candidatus Solibacter usitatus]
MRILLADDHKVLRSGLRRILEEHSDLTVVGEAADGREAVDLANALEPDIIVMDIGMPQMNGMEATRQILQRHPRTNVLILSMYSDENYLIQVLRAGARGYLLKDSAEGELIDAVRSVNSGQPFFSPQIAKLLVGDNMQRLRHEGASDTLELLTPREREVLQLIAEGKSNKEAAAALFVSPTTIETHRARIMDKLDLHSTAEIVLYAVRKGVIHLQ